MQTNKLHKISSPSLLQSSCPCKVYMLQREQNISKLIHLGVMESAAVVQQAYSDEWDFYHGYICMLNSLKWCDTQEALLGGLNNTFILTNSLQA